MAWDILIAPLATIIILVIALAIAFINSTVNRLLINHFIGWSSYGTMQKEMAEYRSETMKAARANDKKQMEKLKKKESQIQAMQTKMMKPQMILMAVSFVYIVVWLFVLTPLYGNNTIAYIPGVGGISVIIWYPICSFFFGLLSSRILGISPIVT